MTKEAEAGVLPAHFENGGDTAGTRCISDAFPVGRNILEKRPENGAKPIQKTLSGNQVYGNKRQRGYPTEGRGAPAVCVGQACCPVVVI